jgi:hypothetical protein
LKIYAADEGRVQTTAAAFLKVSGEHILKVMAISQWTGV